MLTTFYVDTNNSAASDSNPGTSIDLPLKTISQAITLVSNDASKMQSDTVFIRGGIYREEPFIWTSDSGVSASMPTIISAYFNTSTGAYEPVYIDAADPTTGTWVQDGTSNIWYLNNIDIGTAGVWVDWSPANDGASLQQIGTYGSETSAYRKIVGTGVSSMYPGTYYDDSNNNTLYVWLADGSNPNLHTLEYASRSRAIYEPGTAQGSVYTYVNNLDFVALNLRHANVYNTDGQDPGVGIYTENYQQLIDCTIEWNTEDGVHLLGDSQMIDCIASNNGGNGAAAKGSGFLIQSGQYDYNYWRDYNDGGNAGIKVITNTPLPYGSIENIEAAYNYGKGIWYDTDFESAAVSDVTGNYIHDNQDDGLDLEFSRNFLVANNIIADNASDGISVNAVENADIYNNTIVGNNGIAAIELDGGTRNQSAGYPGIVGMLNISIDNNIIANNYSVYDLDVPTLAEPSAEEYNDTSDYNLFYRRGGPLHFTTGGTYLGSWGYAPSLLAEWQEDSGQDEHSIVADPLFIAGGNGSATYMIGSNSPARAMGAQLPSAVTSDYAGNPRPAHSPPDVGAYQYASGPAGTAGPIIIDTNPAIWVDDQLPDNAVMTTPDSTGNVGESRFWRWNSTTVFAGAESLDSTVVSGAHRQYFTGANPRSVLATDNLFAYVYLDPANPPGEIEFEWQDSSGSWAHQAYWGQNQFGAGVDGSEDAPYIGSLPTAGQWVMLSVPAPVVGLTGQQITGFSFDLYNGRALLDDLGNAAIAGIPSITGTVYQDNNGNGTLDPGEPGLSGRTVFVDLHNDGTPDPGDPTAVTNSSGGFAFYNLSPGSYTVDQIPPEDFVASTAAGLSYSVNVVTGATTTLNFGEFPTTFTTNISFIVALSANQSTLNIWQGVPESSSPSYSIAPSRLTQLAIYASSLTIDASNGTPLFSNAISFNGSGTGSLSVIGLTAANNSFIVNSSTVAVNSDTIDFSGVGSISVAGGSGNDTLTSDADPAPISFAGGGGSDLLNVDAGNYTFTGDPQPATASLTVNVAGGASVTFAANSNTSGYYLYHLAGLNLATGASAILARAAIPADRSLLILSSLTFGGTSPAPQGRLDLSNNDLLIHGGNVPNLFDQLASGYAAGNWIGPAGIVSSAAAADPTHLTSLGFFTGSVGTFDGQGVSSTDVRVKYIYTGDTNLDGVIDGSDYTRLDNGLLTHATGWWNGDLNYDGVIDGSDYALLDNAFNTQGSSLTAEIASPHAAVAPASARFVPPVFTGSDAILSLNNSGGSIAHILRSQAYVWMDDPTE